MQKSLRCKDSRLGFGILILFGISLARKSAAEQLEIGHGAGVGFSGIFNEPLSLRVKQGVVTTVGVFVDFAVSYAFKSSGTGQSFAETADAGEHIDEFNQAPGSLWTWVLFWAYLIGTPHQKQKQPVTGCTKQDFLPFTMYQPLFCLLFFCFSAYYSNIEIGRASCRERV